MVFENTSLLPRLRPLDARPMHNDDGQVLIQLHDPSQHAVGTLTVSPAAFFIMMQLDGEHSLEQVKEAFADRFGQPLPDDQLQDLIRQLSQGRYLDDEAFTRYYQNLVDEYRSSPARPTREAALFPGAEGKDLPAQLDELLADGEPDPTLNTVRGLIVPHLDLPRGKPCYANGYRTLAAFSSARRFVILGTNHFGQASAVCATRKDFATPLGTMRNDRQWLDRLQTRLDADLCTHELDHAREHSIELQVVLLQQLFGNQDIRFVPLLCPSPCGPTGFRPEDGQGVELRTFAAALRESLAEDDVPTCLIAGADLSHVGRFFGDQRDLDSEFLEQIAQIDRQMLTKVLSGDAEGFVEHLQETENPTRVCSAGCIYVLMAALPQATPKLLRYHQAVVPEWQNCVTCAAVTFS